MPNIEIRLIQASWIHILEDEINKALADGWTFHGGVFLITVSDGYDFAQVMIRQRSRDLVRSDNETTITRR